MAVIQVSKIPQKEIKAEDLIASFCYHFPQYTFKQAQQMSFRRIKQMLRVARKERAIVTLDMLRVVVAPHTKNASGVSSLLKELRDIIEQ